MGMKNVEKYTRQYFMPPVDCMDWAKKDHIEKAPIWCSVDLRDGTEAGIFQTLGSYRFQRDRGWFSGSFRDRVPVLKNPD